jgi:hypothetical protein
LADQAQGIIQQWGSTLAGLGSVSSENVVPVTKGGTGGTTLAGALAGLGLSDAYKRSNALGSVSQTGGVPTGALMEYVNNTTGEVWKFANGLMLTSQAISYPALSWTMGTGVRYLNVTASLPGGFAATPRLYAQLVESDISTRAAWVTNATASTLSTLSAWLAATSGTTGAGPFILNVYGLGRWY